jgi:hypothetical protein
MVKRLNSREHNARSCGFNQLADEQHTTHVNESVEASPDVRNLREAETQL